MTVLIILFLLASNGFAQTPPDLNSKALTILEQNCGGCHGGSDPYSFDVRDPASLLVARVIQSGNASGSELIRRLEAGIMPLGGYKGQRGVKLPAEDIQILREWIDAGGPESARLPRRVQRQFISESQVLTAIIRDLVSAPEADRPYLRYYSLANLWNSRDVEESELELYRMALSKLVNHLSWKKEIAQPRPLGSENTVLRIDLRNYGWTAETWQEIIASYPYGVERSGLSKEIDRVQRLSGVSLPYIRVDWFIANASTPPFITRFFGYPARWTSWRRCSKSTRPSMSNRIWPGGSASGTQVSLAITEPWSGIPQFMAPFGKVSISPATIPGKTFSGIRWIFGRTAGRSFSICRMVCRRTSSRTGKGNGLTPHP